jgi:hypothetical protein
MIIIACLAIIVGALFCIPDSPGEKTPELWGMPVIMWLFAAGISVFAANRQVRIIRLFFDAWAWAVDLWWRWRS